MELWIGPAAVVLLMVITLGMGMAALEKGRLAERERARIEGRIDQVEIKISHCKDEIQQRAMLQDARLSQLDRKIRIMEAPDPMETLFDKEEEME